MGENSIDRISMSENLKISKSYRFPSVKAFITFKKYSYGLTLHTLTLVGVSVNENA